MLRELIDSAGLGVRTKHLFRWVVTVMIDGVFMLVWAAAQFGIDGLISRLELSVVNRWELRILQVIFAVESFAPIGSFVVSTTWQAVVTARQAIAREVGPARESGSDRDG